MDIAEVFPDDPSEPTVKFAGIFQTPFTVPWAKGRVKPCTGFDTQRRQDDTLFMPRSAFRDLQATPLRYRQCQSTSIEDQSASDIANKFESSTFAISASVGGSFLGASGRGSYEKSVRDNANVSNISVHAEHTCGQIDVTCAPQLEKNAVRVLRYSGDPINEFRRTYGDFYVAGYRVGAANSTTIFGELANKSFFEAKRAELEIKVLFAKIHKSINEVSQSTSDVGSLSVSAFDSLEAFFANFKAYTYEDSLQAGAVAAENKQRAMTIAKRAADILWTEFSLGLDGIVTHDVIDRLCDKGLVTELLLAPFTSLREYQAILLHRFNWSEHE